MIPTLLDESLEDLSRRLEHYETPQWAADAILRHELLTPIVIDPCCGTGVLSEAAKRCGYHPQAYDVHDWGYPGTSISDFLLGAAPYAADGIPFSVLMNPPFSEAVPFVRRAIDLGARKVLCFQRFAWWESDDRREFWASCPPSRIYVCGDRASCWRHDIPLDQRGRKDRDGKGYGSTSTAHAWFVWERGHPPGTLIGHVRKTSGFQTQGENRP